MTTTSGSGPCDSESITRPVSAPRPDCACATLLPRPSSTAHRRHPCRAWPMSAPQLAKRSPSPPTSRVRRMKSGSNWRSSARVHDSSGRRERGSALSLRPRRASARLMRLDHLNRWNPCGRSDPCRVKAGLAGVRSPLWGSTPRKAGRRFLSAKPPDTWSGATIRFSQHSTRRTGPLARGASEQRLSHPDDSRSTRGDLS